MVKEVSPRRSFTPPHDAIASRDCVRPYPRCGGARDGRLTPLIPAINVRAYVFRPVQAVAFLAKGGR